VRRDGLAELAARVRGAPAPKGEVVVVVGPPAEEVVGAADADALLGEALERGSVRDAASSVALATGLPKRELYRRALALASERRRLRGT
ncbi:MAG: 16S rRNA (cytidine(1402)-2'-O)-methyltransferase, partial [Alphaproteobacteria bacterium]